MCFLGGVGRWSLDILMMLRTTEVKVSQAIWLPFLGMNGRQCELGAAGLENGATFDGG